MMNGKFFTFHNHESKRLTTFETTKSQRPGDSYVIMGPIGAHVGRSTPSLIACQHSRLYSLF